MFYQTLSSERCNKTCLLLNEIDGQSGHTPEIYGVIRYIYLKVLGGLKS